MASTSVLEFESDVHPNDQRMVLDNKAVVEAFTNDPITPHAADIYLESFGNGAMFRTGTYIALTIVADIFIASQLRTRRRWSVDSWLCPRFTAYLPSGVEASLLQRFHAYLLLPTSVSYIIHDASLSYGYAVTGALLIQAIRELIAGSSPDGKNVATHAVVFYAFTLSLNLLCTRKCHFDAKLVTE